MPNATVRANARTLPEAEPFTDTMASNAPASPTSALKAAAAAKRAEEEKRWEASRAFTSAYQAWLLAKAAVEIHETSDDDMNARVEAEDQAERSLFTTPAALGEELWDKLTAFEWLLGQELTSGLRRNSILMLALGSIKHDIINLDVLETIR
jgi:hypothetical protein